MSDADILAEQLCAMYPTVNLDKSKALLLERTDIPHIFRTRQTYHTNHRAADRPGDKLL